MIVWASQDSDKLEKFDFLKKKPSAIKNVVFEREVTQIQWNKSEFECRDLQNYQHFPAFSECQDSDRKEKSNTF